MTPMANLNDAIYDVTHTHSQSKNK